MMEDSPVNDYLRPQSLTVEDARAIADMPPKGWPPRREDAMTPNYQRFDLPPGWKTNVLGSNVEWVPSWWAPMVEAVAEAKGKPEPEIAVLLGIRWNRQMGREDAACQDSRTT